MAMTMKRVTVRLDADRSDVLAGLSQRLGVGEAEVLRIALDALADRIPVGFFEPKRQFDDETKAVIAHYMRSLTAVGNNLNQLVRSAHLNGWPDTLIKPANDAVDDVREAVAEARTEVFAQCR